LPEIIEEVQPSTGLIDREYEFVYGGKTWTWELQIPQSLYDYYKGKQRPPTQNYSVYVTHPLDDTIVSVIVSEIERIAQEEGYTELEKVEFTNTFVQSLPYTADSVTTPFDEYPRYPVETLVDNGGDCEDTSILLASFLNTMDYAVILIEFPGRHCAVGVLGGEGIYGHYFEYNDGKYYFIETTDTGWGVGGIPEEYLDAKAFLFDMTPTPILTHDWNARGKGSFVELEVTVENLGSAPSYDTYVLAGFDAGGGLLWNPQESQHFTLDIHERIDITFNLKVPVVEQTRLVIQIAREDYAVDESHSEWIDVK